MPPTSPNNVRANRNSVSTRRFLALVTPYRGLFLLALLALAGGSGINLLIPEIIRQLLNAGDFELLRKTPILAGGILISLFVIQGVCFFFRSYLFGSIGQRIVNNLRSKLYHSIVAQKMEFFDRNRVGDLVSRISSDTLMIQDALSTKLSVFIRYALQVVVGVGLMVLLSVKLTTLLVVMLPLLVGISMVLGKRLRGLSKRQQTELGRATNIAEETIGGISVVKAFNQANYEANRFDTAIGHVLRAGLSRTKLVAFFSSFVSFLMNASIILVLVYGMTLVGSDQMSVGDLTAFMLYGVIVAISFAFIASGYSDFVQALGAADRIFELTERERESDIKQPDQISRLPEITEPVEVRFENVSFAYPTRSEATVLSGVTFDLQPGTTTALVGPSGAGKSTIVNLLLGLYQPTGGTLTIQGASILDQHPESVRDLSAIVPQDPLLFAVSLAENLRYGKRDATAPELRSACEKANILDFIESLPDGFETYVGERGVQLSGGQKQRVAIARAILRDPPLLILDEATSSLDSESEHLIQESLAKLMKGRTSLVIAHRLSTVKSADQIVVLEGGQVVEIGTHAAMVGSGGLYSRLVERQDVLRAVG